MAPRWKSGVFLGYSRDSHEYVIWDTAEKMLKPSRTLKRVPESERFSVTHLASVTVRPKDSLHRSSWRPVGQREREQRLGRDDEGEPEPETRWSHVRGLKITKKDPRRI